MTDTSLRPDYRALRLSNITSPAYRHILLLLYWPVHGLLFLLLERGGLTDRYTAVQCALDSLIPFNEWFFIPYLFWFVYLIGALVYTFFFDVPAFRRMMRFIILTYAVTLLIYFLWPTCQLLRPDTFPRDNIMTRFAAWFYEFDTNTNVCPSIHVLGAIAVSVGMWDCGRFRKTPWRLAFTAMTALISVSTLLVKQHSLLDVLAAAALSAAALPLVSASALSRAGRRKDPLAAKR